MEELSKNSKDDDLEVNSSLFAKSQFSFWTSVAILFVVIMIDTFIPAWTDGAHDFLSGPGFYWVLGALILLMLAVFAFIRSQNHVSKNRIEGFKRNFQRLQNQK